MAIVNPALQTLAQQNPMQNSRIAQGQQAARAGQLQQTVAAAPMQGPKAAQAVGTQQAQQAGAINVQDNQQTVADQSTIAKQALAEQANQAALTGKKTNLALKKKADGLKTKLDQIDRGLKNKLIDETIAFEKDDLNRTLWNERQLMDYKLQSANRDIELQKYEQEVNQLSQKRTQMLQLAYKKIEQELANSQSASQQNAGQEQTKRLQQAKVALEQKLSREAARRKNRAAMISAVGMVGGAVVGTMVAPGAGTAAGASLGAGAGSIAASQTE